MSRASCISRRSSATPACGRDPALSDEVNVQATRGLVADAGEAGVQRLVFASTCSNYGRMADPTVPITEDGELSPVSLYAEQKVSMEKLILGGETSSVKPTCLRFATVYGVGRRMRFDLTVNEFTRDLWGDRELEVFGEQFWRPYIHVRDAGRAVLGVLEAPAEKVAHNVFNAGRSGETYRKLDLVEEIGKQVDRGTVSYVKRDEDPRDYKVSFDQDPCRARLRDADDRPRRHRRDHRGARCGHVRRPLRTALPQHPLSERLGL